MKGDLRVKSEEFRKTHNCHPNSISGKLSIAVKII